ncbi:hypothetical protein FA13DRAFT_1757962 [Coprinellus micaceus]|uniref:Transmembrane protein n=1 Tax=Coprinellus micaceus TaxID=71717 RepID=A0A4Y7SEY8_COPMI|nr:hypothetical protein FA13DRAFT_1757962 [Coprinellus micaceus]
MTRAPSAYSIAECVESVRSGAWGTGLIGATDERGTIIDKVGNACGVTFDLCVRACGAGQAPFAWSTFSSNSLSGQKNRLNSLESALLTLGSPTLAAYSLYLTILNARWISHRFSKCNYPNVRTAARVLTSLQQSPLRVTEGDALLASLVVLPQNDRWWKELIEWLEYPHTWSIGAFTATLWVVIAHLLTVINWFRGSVQPEEFGDQAIGSLWVWLLPIVVGWLLISPTCNEARLESAVERVNWLAYVATDHHIILVRHLPEKRRAISLDFDVDDELRVDERNTAPIYNYARVFSWTQSVEVVLQSFEAASTRAHQHESVDPSVDWAHARRNAEDVCVLERGGGRVQGRWGQNVVLRVITSSFLGLFLQWGTTGAAISIAYNTPTTGLSCVSGSYLLFAVLSTAAWVALLASSVLGHYAVTESRRLASHTGPTWPVTMARALSILLRRFGKFVAVLNAVWSVATCLLQFGQFYNRCYCNSSVIGRRSSAYVAAKLPPAQVRFMVHAWISGASQAVFTAIVCLAVVVVYRNPTLPMEALLRNRRPLKILPLRKRNGCEDNIKTYLTGYFPSFLTALLTPSSPSLFFAHFFSY